MEDSRNNKIETKLDLVVDNIGEIKVHIAEIRKDLKYHIRRTDILEESVTPMWLTFKSFGFIAALIGVAAGLAEIIHIFR